jgi:hypothetical protein
MIYSKVEYSVIMLFKAPSKKMYSGKNQEYVLITMIKPARNPFDVKRLRIEPDSITIASSEPFM